MGGWEEDYLINGLLQCFNEPRHSGVAQLYCY